MLEQAIRKAFDQFNDGKCDLFTIVLQISLALRDHGEDDKTGLNEVGFQVITGMIGMAYVKEIQSRLDKILDSVEGDKEVGKGEINNN